LEQEFPFETNPMNNKY